MAKTYEAIADLRQRIDSHNFSINYSRKFLEENRAELKATQAKYESISEHEVELSRKTEETEISHMRTEMIFEQVLAYVEKVQRKLNKVEGKIDCILGDSMLMAACCCYLGIFTLKERDSIRSEIMEFLHTAGINCSAGPHLLKQALKDYGLLKAILPHTYSKILSDRSLCESLFTLIFAPSCPVVFDPTGALELFLKDVFGINNVVSGADRKAAAKVEGVLRSQGSFAIVTDVNDSSCDYYGATQADSGLQGLCQQLHNGFDFNLEKIKQLRQLHSLSHFVNSYADLNKRVPANFPDIENLSFYQVQLFMHRLKFCLNSEFEAKSTIVIGMDSSSEAVLKGTSTAWIELKEIMMFHFIPEKYKELKGVEDKLKTNSIKKFDLH